VDDNGRGLRALFYGLCCFHGVTVWDQEDAGVHAADFYLPAGMGTFVVIIPEPAARQVEIAALRAQQEHFIVLDRDDLDQLRLCPGGAAAGFLVENWVKSGATHAAQARRSAGIP